MRKVKDDAYDETENEVQTYKKAPDAGTGAFSFVNSNQETLGSIGVIRAPCLFTGESCSPQHVWLAQLNEFSPNMILTDEGFRELVMPSGSHHIQFAPPPTGQHADKLQF